MKCRRYPKGFLIDTQKPTTRSSGPYLIQQTLSRPDAFSVSPTPSRRGRRFVMPKIVTEQDKLKRACHSGNPGLPRGRHRQAPPAGAASAGYPKALISLGGS
jgi:hypothetical protein